EKRLLNDLGYGLQLTMTDEGLPVERDRYYRVAVERGPQTCVAEAPGAVYGRSLTDLDAESFEDARSLRDAKRVLRAAIDACLDGRSLKSREVMLALRQARRMEITSPQREEGGAPRHRHRRASRWESTSTMWRRCARRAVAAIPIRSTRRFSPNSPGRTASRCT